MERKVSWKKYLVAFILTLMIFSIGIVLGIKLEDARLLDSKKITLNEKVSLQSLQLQQNYIDSGIADCNTLKEILEANIDELVKKMALVNAYEKKAVFNEDEFNLQLREYFLTEIQFLMVSQEIDKKCTKDSVKILYFYDEGLDDTQGNILVYLKKLFGSRLLIFSFNSNFYQEPMIKILLTSYNIKKFPAVVIEDKVFQGNQPIETIMEQVCIKFDKMKKEVPKECEKIFGK